MQLHNVGYVLEGHVRSRSVMLQLAFASLGIAIGVALLFASQISSASLNRSAAELNTTRLVGAAQVQLDARGPDGFDPSVLAQVQEIPGVLDTLPIVERQVGVIGRRGERLVDLIGVEPYSLQTRVPFLHRFSAKLLDKVQGIALPEPLVDEINAGVASELQIGGRVVPTLVGALLTREDIGSLVLSPVALTSIRYAQSLTHTHGLTRIFVHYAGRDERRVLASLASLAAVNGLSLNGANHDHELFSFAVMPESESELLFSGISALVGFLFALNAMLIGVPARRKLIADLREDGASLLDLTQVLGGEALLLAVPACLLGLVAGDVLSAFVFHADSSYLAFAFPIGNARIVTAESVGIAVFAGVMATLLGVFWPVRHIFARHIGGTPEWRLTRRMRVALLAFAAACLATTTSILFLDTRAALVGNVMLVAALIALLPFVLGGLLGIVQRFVRVVGGVAGESAIDELRAPQTRVRALAIAGLAAVAVFGIVEFGGVASNLQRGLDASARDLDSNATVWISARGGAGLLSTTTLAPLNQRRLARVAGVRSVASYYGGFLDWGQRRLWVKAPAGSSANLAPPTQLSGVSRATASARLREGGWALLSAGVAREMHIRVGSRFILPAPRPLALRLAGETTNLGWPPGSVILNASNYAIGWPAVAPAAYEVQVVQGARVSAVRDRLAAVLRGNPGLSVETAGERERRHFALAAKGLSRLTQIRRLVLVCAILALVAAMLSLLWQRRDRIAFNRSNGIPTTVLWRALVCESAILLGAGSLVGAVWGLYAQLLGSHFLATVTGFPIIFSIEGLSALSGFLLVSGTAVAVLAVPGYLAVGVRAKSVSPAY